LRLGVLYDREKTGVSSWCNVHIDKLDIFG